MANQTENQPQIIIVRDAAALAETAARHFAQCAQRHTKEQGRFTVALSGGSTPRAMFSLLAEEPYRSSLQWASIFFFWGDERSVPPDHPESNYRTAHDVLLSKVSVPSQNIFRIPAELGPERAASEYSAQLRSFFGLDAQPDELPKLDLVFLGMGADGHTASLFPGTSALQAGREIAVSTYVEKLQMYRTTLTAATINNAEEVVFLIAGQDKAATLHEVLLGEHQPDKYPSQLIQPATGNLIWMIDEAAGSDLKGHFSSL